MPFWNELYGTAMKLTRQPADAHDLVQDTFLRAYQAWSRFEHGSNCRAWLFRILTNGYLNRYRKQKRHTQFHIVRRDDTVRAVYGSAKGHVDDPETELLNEGLGDEVTHALATLAAEQRAVIEMADIRGVRYRDIAALLGVPLGTVMSRLHRARRHLERRLSRFAADHYGIRRAASAA